MVVTVPPKVSVSELMGILKGKTAINLFKCFPTLKKKPHWVIISGAAVIV